MQNSTNLTVAGTQESITRLVQEAVALAYCLGLGQRSAQTLKKVVLTDLWKNPGLNSGGFWNR